MKSCMDVFCYLESALNEMDLSLAFSQLVVAVADGRRGNRHFNYCSDNITARNNGVWLGRSESRQVIWLYSFHFSRTSPLPHPLS